MIVDETDLPGVLVIHPDVHGDERGFFKETFNAARYAREAGIELAFVQDNVSRSKRGTIRGIHFQEPNPQGKLVWCAAGAVWDVAVDLRRGSPTFGQWAAVELTAEAHTQFWVPPGFGHGFCVLSDVADFAYKCTALYSPADERTVRWDDPDLAIAWPVADPLVSDRDRNAPLLAAAEVLSSY